MYSTSQAFKDAVYAPLRYCKGRITYEMSDLTAWNTNNKFYTDEEVFSNVNQLTNKNKDARYNLCTFEKDFIKLDGNMLIPPETTPSYEIGYISGGICDSNGLFNNMYLLFTWNEPHNSAGITITFDKLNNEYAVDFDIIYTSNNVDNIVNITNNNKVNFEYKFQFSNYTMIKIQIKKWSKPYRRCRVVEVDFGLSRIFEDKDLIRFNTVHEMDRTCTTLPIGQLNFTVDNLLKEFNILNSYGYYNFLQQRQNVLAEIGVELEDKSIEWIPLNRYYLKEWKTEQNSLLTTFKATDIIDFLSNKEVENKTLRNITLYNLATEVLINSGISDFKLSENLKDINTKGLHNKTSYRNLLQLLAIAGQCVVFADNTGKLHVQQLKDAEGLISSINATESIISNKNQIIDNNSNYTLFETLENNFTMLDGSYKVPSTNKSEMGSYQVGYISEQIANNNGTFTTPNSVMINISKEHLSTSFSITFYKEVYAVDFDVIFYAQDNSIKLTKEIRNNSLQEVKIFSNLIQDCRKIEIKTYKINKPNSRLRIIEINTDEVLDTITFDNIYKEPSIKLNQSVKSIEITYYPTNLDTKETYVLNTDNEKGITLKLDNSLINTLDHAKDVASWILQENTLIAEFDIDWRGNPSHCLGDKISIENAFNGFNIAQITKQELNYQGYLSAKTTCKGGI